MKVIDWTKDLSSGKRIILRPLAVLANILLLPLRVVGVKVVIKVT